MKINPHSQIFGQYSGWWITLFNDLIFILRFLGSCFGIAQLCTLLSQSFSKIPTRMIFRRMGIRVYISANSGNQKVKQNSCETRRQQFLGNCLENCIFVHKHFGNPVYLERIVQLQLCVLAMQSLHMQWSLFNDNCIHSQRRQLGFQLELCTLSMLAHYIWWPLGDNFPHTSASSAFLHCFPCLIMNKNM